MTLVRKADWPESIGYTRLVAESDAAPEFGLQKGAKPLLVEACVKETVWVLLGGKARVEWSSGEAVVSRESLFDEEPTVFHAARGTRVRITPLGEDTEWAVAQAENSAEFESKLYLPESVVPEYRGHGLVQGACLRNVRQVFDFKTRPLSKLVLGEVVNLPGRWSSYPPHHHAQPEIYHYRFTLPQGYGHAECGESVYKVRAGDTLLIPGGNDHAQVCAPGYGMYYLWIVKHLEGRPYEGFEFTDEHRWMLNPEHQGWEPKGWKL